MNKYFTLKELAEFLGIQKESARRMVKQRGLKGFYLCGKLRVDAKDLEEWIARRKKNYESERRDKKEFLDQIRKGAIHGRNKKNNA